MLTFNLLLAGIPLYLDSDSDNIDSDTSDAADLGIPDVPQGGFRRIEFHRSTKGLILSVTKS